MRFWSTAPRKVGTPFKSVCKTKEDLVSSFNILNGTVDKLYVSLYECNEFGNGDKTKLNVIGFDIDWDDKYNSMVELHNHFLKNDWKHKVMFSTGGFWLYLDCKETIFDKQKAKQVLSTMQLDALKGTSLKFGKPKECPIDNNVLGDVERLTRMPFSFDKTRNRWVIFLSQEDIDKGMDYILDISTNCDVSRRTKVYEFGNKIAFDPEEIKVVIKNNNEVYNDIIDGKYELSIPTDIDNFNKNMLEQLPDCLKAWVIDPEYSTWRARAFITLYLKEKGFTREQVRTFLKPFFEKVQRSDRWGNNWNHYLNAAQADQHVFRRNDLKFPSCRAIYEEGLCKGCSNLKEKNFSLPYRYKK